MNALAFGRGRAVSLSLLTVLALIGSLLAFAGSVSGQSADELCDPRDGVNFSDVSDSDYGSGHILCARTLGLAKGKASGESGPEFGPRDNLRRDEMAVFLARLWRDVLGRVCPAGGHPFDDLTGNFAEDDVSCIYQLDITGGTSPVTYGPSDPVTPAQMTRFVARLLNGVTPATCDTSGNELDKAATCLANLNIVANTAEAKSTNDATRAQMAVYLIGAWHHAAGRGKPPAPPALPATTSPTTSTPASPDAFKAVAAGAFHSCGLRTDDTITCWGDNDNGQLDAPAGRFKAVTAGERHSCGLRTDGTVTCWGSNLFEQADAPAGNFKAVTAGLFHSCGLRTDDTITCWGARGYVDGRTDAPAGSFKAVTAGDVHSCGLRTDGTVTCWGPNGFGQTDAPAGSFKSVTAGGFHSCGLRTDGTVTCWGSNFISGRAPAGNFKAVTAGERHSCGLRTDDTITCWGNNDDGQTDAPAGSFKSVSAGDHSCGLRTDGTITCWGNNGFGQADAPAGTTTTTTTTTVPPAGSPALTGEVTECVADPVGILGYDVTISGTVHANRAVSDVTVSRWEPDPLSGYAGDFQWTRDRLGSLSAGESKNFSISTVYPHYIRHPSDSDCQVWVNFSEE